MKLAWIFCLLLAGKLSTADPGEERAAAEASLGSGYMMAFPMNDDNLAEESAQEAVKILAESLASDDDDDDDEDDSTPTEQPKKEDEVAEGAEKKDEQPEPMGILQAELAAEDEAEKPSLPERPFFKRPKIEELRKILGFPPPEGAAKAKPIPQEKPKVFQNIFNKPKFDPKPKIEQSPLGGLQFNLRREDRMRPFGFPMLPLKRDDSFRPFGIPDLVQAASTILRRAIVDDNNENDISKDDKEEEEPQMNENEPEDNEEEDEDESVMIVPLPDPKEVTIERPPLFRRFPIPLPFPVPRPAPQARPRLPFPPLTPVAFFLPIAQQIMQNIRQSQPRPQPTMIPMAPNHHIQHQMQNLVPLQTQIPIVHIQPPMQQQQQQQFIPIHHPMIPMHQPVQQFVPFFPMPQAAIHVPILTPLPPNMQRPVLRQMPRRMPVHPPQQMPRRLPVHNPMARMAAPQHHVPMQPQMVNPMMRRPMQTAPNTRPMPRVVRPPMPPVHPVLFMMAPMPVPSMHVPISHQQQVPVFHRPQQLPFVPQQMAAAMSQPRHVMQPVQVPEEERVIFIRPDQEDQDDDQEVLILVPSDEVEVAQRPPFLPPQFIRQVPTPVVNPLQRIKILRDLLLARQANRQAMHPDARASRVVEIVQQQLRIFPAHHPQVQQPQMQRPESSELHPVYVPYPGPQ